MEILDVLNRVQTIIRKNPALLSQPSVKKAFETLNKSANVFKKVVSPYQNIQFTDYLDLKEAIKGKTSTKNLSALNQLLARYHLSFTQDRSGKVQVESFLIEACKSGKVVDIIKELKRKPEDVYREQLFKLTESSDSALFAKIDRQFTDTELKKFMKVNLISEGKENRKYSRKHSIENVIYKVKETRSRI